MAHHDVMVKKCENQKKTRKRPKFGWMVVKPGPCFRPISKLTDLISSAPAE
jgi:hypothetical protein